MADNAHPLLGGMPGFVNVNDARNSVSVGDGQLHVDATPLYLLGVVAVSALVLAMLKKSGFKFVIGVGG